MKKNYLAFIFIISTITQINLAQTHQVPSESFPNLSSVAAYINTNPPTENNLVFELAGNEVFNESIITFTASGSPSAPIIIQWNGTGEKPIINFTGDITDNQAGITLSGASHIIIDGLDIRNPDGMLEYGIYLTNSDSISGSQHNIIKNTSITLNKTNPYVTTGIRLFQTVKAHNQDGSNSFNSFVNNHISNTIFGYYLNSNTGEVSLMDSGNEIGIANDGEHIIEDIVFCGTYLLNQNGGIINGITMQNLNRPDDGTNTAPAAISTTGTLPSGPLTEPFIISNNTIKGFFSESTTIFGMYLNQRNVHNEVYNNVLDNIRTDGIAGSYASGIFLFATDATANIYNNMLSDISASAGSLANAASVRGIDVRNFNWVNIYHNTVFLHFLATNPDNKSAALNVHNANSPVDIRNNIFVNNTVVAAGGTGFATAFFKSTNTLNNIQNSSDNNIFYTGEPFISNYIFYGHNSSAPAKDLTLDEYKLRALNFDQQSFTENVPFLGRNLPLVNPLIATAVRGNAQPITSPITITDDINGRLRDTITPDIGAGELAEPIPLNAINPTPENGRIDVVQDLSSLQWEYQIDEDYVSPIGFKVYLSSDATLTNEELVGWVVFDSNLKSFTFNLADYDLEFSTTYFWKVIPSIDQTNGPDAPDQPVWSFTTEDIFYEFPNLAQNPIPGHSSVNIALDLEKLSWDFTPNGSYALPAGFKVYFGSSDILTEADKVAWVDYNASTTAYTFDVSVSLNYFTTYFWKIVPSVNAATGPDTQNPEIWSFKTIDDVSVGKQKTDSFKFFPNPTENQVRISASEPGFVSIFDAQGRMVRHKKVFESDIIIDLGSLSEGLYSIHFRSDVHIVNRTLVISR